MKYTQKTFDKAEAVLSQRRKDSAADLERRRKSVYAEMPEVKTLENKIQSSYFELVKLVANHEPNAKSAAEIVRDNNLATQARITMLVKNLTGDADYLKPRFVCEKCRDTGYIEGVRCSCFEDLLRTYAAEELNESSTIALRDFAEYRPEFYPEGDPRKHMNQIYSYLLKYCREFPRGTRPMLFIGRTGLGKTFLASCMAKKLASDGFSVAIGSVSDFMRKIEDEHFGRSEGNTLDTLLQADFVIIDDLGSEFSSPFYEAAFYSVINGRINQKKPTVITTNLTKAELNNKYNERICTRLLNEFLPIQFVGNDIRQQKMENRLTKNQRKV